MKDKLLLILPIGVCAAIFFLSEQVTSAQQHAQIETISAVELKDKVSKNDPVTILDVRATESYSNSSNKIKGALHLKLRRLKSRLSYPPLKDLSHDSYIVTYCACPNDEASVRAAEILVEAGFTRVKVLRGGWTEWLKNTGQTEPRPRGM